MANHATILLVDDDRQFLRALHVALSTAGYTVATAVNPSAALEYVVGKKQPFDLIITDVQMPALDGLRLLHLVNASVPHVPVIVVTAFGSAPVQTQALRAGAFAFLTKPFSKSEIVAVAELALQSVRKETQP